MFRNRVTVMAFLFIAVGVIIGLVISSNFDFFSKGYTEDKISKDAISLLTKINQATEEVANA
jgi:hypothetical protein